MKTIILISLLASVASAETYHLSAPSGAVSKFEALRKTIASPETVVYKCSAVQLTQKGTFKNIPASGGNDFISAPKK